MKPLPKQTRIDICRLFKSGADVPYLATVFRCKQEQIEQAIRLRLMEQERGEGRYKASDRDANRLLKLVGTE